MNITEIQNEIISTICLIGDQIIQNDLPAEVIDTNNDLIRESKAKLLELLSEYDREIKVDFAKVFPVMKNDLEFLRTIRNDRNWFNEEGKLESFVGLALLLQFEDMSFISQR